MEALKYIPYLFIMLAIGGIVAGASVLSMSHLGDTMDKCYSSAYTYNSSFDSCLNNTPVSGAEGFDDLNLSDEYYSVTQGKGGLSTVSGQFTTVGIIAVMVIIISLLVGLFAYMQYFR